MPETDISTALADSATIDPAKAESPIFFKLSIITPFKLILIYEWPFITIANLLMSYFL